MFYRRYMIDRHDHILGPADLIKAASDSDAVKEAEQVGTLDPRCTAIEVWQGDRRIMRGPPVQLAVADGWRQLAAAQLVASNEP